MSGIFITLEGCDGSGKTTQVQLLSEYFSNIGYSVICTREPGGTSVGNEIRSILLTPGQIIHARAEALLYMAARAEHVDSLIAPALAAGKVVISDRYADSTIVYQGAARNLPRAELEALNKFATNGLAPNLTIVLDGQTAEFCQRLTQRGGKDRMDQEGFVFHELVRKGFLELAKLESDRIKVVDASASVENVHQQIIRIVKEFLNGRGI